MCRHPSCRRLLSTATCIYFGMERDVAPWEERSLMVRWIVGSIPHSGPIVLFYDALNTFYLRLYSVRHMVRTIQIAREETRCRHMGYSFRLTARVILYAPSHRQGSTYHGLCYISRGALAGSRNSSMGPPHEGSIQRPIAS